MNLELFHNPGENVFFAKCNYTWRYIHKCSSSHNIQSQEIRQKIHWHLQKNTNIAYNNK